MRASSTASLAKALVTLDQNMGKKTKESEGLQIAEELFALGELTAKSGRLSRCLTDPAREPEAKQELAAQLFQGKTTAAVYTAVMQLVAGRWSAEKDLSEACHMLAVHVLLKVAQDIDRLDKVEADIFGVAQLLHTNRRLRGALSDNSSSDAKERIALVTKLIKDQVDPISLRLIQDAVLISKAGRLQSNLRGIEDAAAALRSQGMATVISAVELSPEQVERVRRVLAAEQGHDMVIKTVVDPEVVGGMRIRYADSVVDGSISNTLNETRRQLVS